MNKIENSNSKQNRNKASRSQRNKPRSGKIRRLIARELSSPICKDPNCLLDKWTYEAIAERLNEKYPEILFLRLQELGISLPDGVYVDELLDALGITFWAEVKATPFKKVATVSKPRIQKVIRMLDNCCAGSN